MIRSVIPASSERILPASGLAGCFGSFIIAKSFLSFFTVIADKQENFEFEKPTD